MSRLYTVRVTVTMTGSTDIDVEADSGDDAEEYAKSTALDDLGWLDHDTAEAESEILDEVEADAE